MKGRETLTMFSIANAWRSSTKKSTPATTWRMSAVVLDETRKWMPWLIPQISAICLISSTVDSSSTTSENMLPPAAEFCCPSSTSGLAVHHASPSTGCGTTTTVFDPRRNATAATTPVEMETPSLLPPASALPARSWTARSRKSSRSLLRSSPRSRSPAPLAPTRARRRSATRRSRRQTSSCCSTRRRSASAC